MQISTLVQRFILSFLRSLAFSKNQAHFNTNTQENKNLAILTGKCIHANCTTKAHSWSYDKLLYQHLVQCTGSIKQHYTFIKLFL